MPLGNIRLGSHLLGAVGNDPESQATLVFSFLADGLRYGEMCIYITPEKPSIVKQSMDRWGLDTSTINTHIKIIPTSSVYPPSFKPESVISTFEETYEEARNSGFSGLRAVDLVRSNEEERLSALIDADLAFNKRNSGITTFCIYENLQAYDLAKISKLIGCHSAIVWPPFWTPKDLSGLLSDAIWFGLDDVLGTNGAKAAFHSIWSASGITPIEKYWQEVSENPDIFYRPLERFFGQGAEEIADHIKEKMLRLAMSDKHL